MNAGSPATRKSPASNTPTVGTTPPNTSLLSTPPTLLTNASYDPSPSLPLESVVGSPMKKQRASLSGLDDEAMRQRLGLGLSGMTADTLPPIEQGKAIKTEPDEDEEL